MKYFVGSICRPAFAIWLALIFALGSVASAHGQTAPPAQQGPPIISTIEVQYVGPQTIAKERVLAQLRTKPGQPYSESLVEQDIRALYATGTVQNVRIFGGAGRGRRKGAGGVQTAAPVKGNGVKRARRRGGNSLRQGL